MHFIQYFKRKKKTKEKKNEIRQKYGENHQHILSEKRILIKINFEVLRMCIEEKIRNFSTN